MGIEFDNDEYKNSVSANKLNQNFRLPNENSSNISNWLVKRGLARDDSKANIFSIVFAIVLVVLAVTLIWFYFFRDTSNETIEITPEIKSQLPANLQNVPDSFLPKIIESDPRYKYISQ